MENKKIEKNSGSVESNDNGNDSSFDFSDMEEPDRIGDIERGETLKVEENEEKNLNNEDENIERRKSKTSVKLPPIITGNKNPSTVDKERDVRLEKIEKLSFKEEMDSKTKETNPKGNGSSKNYGSSNKFQSEEEEEKKEVTPKRKRETPRASETPAKDLPNRREQSRVVQQQKRMQARHRNAEILQARRAAGRQNRGRNLRHRRRASQSSPGEEEQQGDNKEEKIQVFIERDSHTSFCQFLSSEFASGKRKCYIWVTLLFFLALSACSFYELIKYFISDCKHTIGFGLLLIFYFCIVITFKSGFYIFMLLEIYGNIEYLIKIPHLIPLSALLISPSFNMSLYTYDFNKCEEINYILGRDSSFIFSVRIFHGILAYTGLRVLTAMLNPMLKKSKKKSVQSFRRAWYSVLSIIIYFFMVFMMILTIVLIFTQKFARSIGLLIDTVALVFFSLIAAILSYYQSCKKQIIFEMIPLKDEDSEEQQTILQLQPADLRNVREMRD